MAKIVRIQSTMTITVTPGLQHKDVTNPDAHVPDRLKVSPLWPKAMVMIKQGVGYYPAEIIEWPVVKLLEKDSILTIGTVTESEETEYVEAETKLENELEAIDREATTKRKRKGETLAELVSED